MTSRLTAMTILTHGGGRNVVTSLKINGIWWKRCQSKGNRLALPLNHIATRFTKWFGFWGSRNRNFRKQWQFSFRNRDSSFCQSTVYALIRTKFIHRWFEHVSFNYTKNQDDIIAFSGSMGQRNIDDVVHNATRNDVPRTHNPETQGVPRRNFLSPKFYCILWKGIVHWSFWV